VGRVQGLPSLYGRIGRTYLSWAPALLLLAVIVFIPVGLLDALAIRVEAGSLDFEHGLHLLAAVAATGAITLTSLFGEVFFSGAVAVSLTHPEHGHAPSLRAIARRLAYGRLIAIDVLYGVIVTVGLLLLVAPGVAAFAWLGLAGPVVEIERRSVRGALSRSVSLVRGSFWTVLLVLGPIELFGDLITAGLEDLAHGTLGHSLLATWLAESAANILFTPVFAVAAVLLTLDRIRARDGEGPLLNPSPTPSGAKASLGNGS